jgi:RNA polymerase sigma-70 factor (ECF subfamily)
MDFSVNKIKDGDLKEFEQLFRELYSPLCSYASQIINDNDKAEELVQDIFYGIWKNRLKLDIKVSFKAYLYKAIQNNCLQLIHHKQVEEKYKQQVAYSSMEFQSDPMEELEAIEMNLLIEKTLEDLPERCRQIFSMSRFDGLKYKEIAQNLDISIKTVEANMGKALNIFRQNLKSYIGANTYR